MKQLYLSCPMGCSGDMINGALLGLSSSPQKIIEKLNGIGLNGVRVEYIAQDLSNDGSFSVYIDGKEEGEHRHTHEHEHHARSLEHIANTIDGLDIPWEIKKMAREIYDDIAAAESSAHNMPIEKIHLHEVGNTDAICDIVSACIIMAELGEVNVTASPINTGSGKVMTEHGLLDVPAPATKLLLGGIPHYTDGTECELCTPTGAALIKHFTKNFSEKLPFTPTSSAQGYGKKKFDKPNCVYAYLGEENGN